MQHEDWIEWRTGPGPGGLRGLSRLLRSCWKDAAGTAESWVPERLRCELRRPGQRPELRLLAVSEGETVGFAIGLPQACRFGGRRLELVLPTLLSVAPQARGRGLGRRLFAELLRRAQARGADGALWYCVDGGASNSVTTAAARRVGDEPTELEGVAFAAATLGRDPASATGVAGSREEALACALALAEEPVVADRTLSRSWSPTEAAWLCRGRERSLALHGEGGGLVVGAVRSFEDPAVPDALVLDECRLDGLELDRRQALLHRVRDGARALGASVLCAPLRGPADERALRVHGLRRSRLRLRTWFAPWTAEARSCGRPPHRLEVA